MWKVFTPLVVEVAMRITKGKKTLLHKFVYFQMPNKGLKCFIIWVRNYLFLKNYVTSEGAVGH